MKTPALILAFTLLSAPVLAAPGHSGGHGGSHDHYDGHAAALGEPGDPKAKARTVNIVMSDEMRFSPETVTVKRGETIRFVVKNAGQLRHEMTLGTMEELVEHAAVMEKHPDMEHDDPNAVTVEPGQSKTILWKFTKTGSFDYGCLVPGHMPAGMKGRIVVRGSLEKTMKQIIATIAAGMILLATNTAFAQTGNTEGEVRRVDKSTGKITLRHGPVTGALEMPAMSMVFQTKDPALLDRLKPGDKGRFIISKDDGGYWILSAEPEK